MANSNVGVKKPACPKCKDTYTENVMVGGKASGLRRCPECGTFYRVVLEEA